jgi:hypothetical protein
MSPIPSPRRFLGYADTDDVPNIVVDGSPNHSTVLTLTHWPGIAAPPGLEADLSAEMAYRYLDDPPEHDPAAVVTNNHFDQDGLVAVHALVDPEAALGHRELLTDTAAAGDFGTYRHRAAARASMAIWAYGRPELSPIADALHRLSPAERCRTLYEATLPLLVPMATEPERFRDLWGDEDDRLTASEKALADGSVTVEEHLDVDLALVRIEPQVPPLAGHRFGGDVFEELHPLALHNATGCLRLLLVQGSRYRFVDRYETWVQYRSRRPLPRIDLQPLAERLSELETGAVTWTATPPSSLAPTLAATGDSSLAPPVVVHEITEALRSAAPAWDPYRITAS